MPSSTGERVYEYIVAALRSGRSPTQREIMRALGLRSTTPVCYWLKRLTADGRIYYIGRNGRALDVPGRAVVMVGDMVKIRTAEGVSLEGEYVGPVSSD